MPSKHRRKNRVIEQESEKLVGCWQDKAGRLKIEQLNGFVVKGYPVDLSCAV